MVANDQPGRNVPARMIPVPKSVSPEAQAVLASDGPVDWGPQPDGCDKAAWEHYAVKANATLSSLVAAGFELHKDKVAILEHELSHAMLYEIVPVGLPPDDKSCLYFVHGGSFVIGGGLAAAHAAASLAVTAQLRTFSIDYRMPPRFPFPAGLDDAVDAYRFLLERYEPTKMAVYGPSAGGGLAASCLLKARDLGLPMPAACVLHSPEADLTESGDSFETNNGIDAVLTRLTNSIAIYADGHDLRDPHLSPLFGDFSRGFPPTYLTTGTRDLFLSNTVLMHRALLRAGMSAELHVWEAMDHGGFYGSAPEDREMLADEVRFLRQHLRLA